MSRNAPITKEHRFFEGESKQPYWDVKDDDAGGAPLSVDNWTLALYVVRRRDGEGPVLIEKTHEDGLTVTDSDDEGGENSRIIAEIEPDDTIGKGGHTYYYALWGTDPLGERSLLAEGDWTIQNAPYGGDPSS